jgi:MFS family permease
MAGRMNWNAKLAIAQAGAMGFSNGIWNYTVLSLYLFELCGNNTLVGTAEGIQGAVRSVAALPTGWIADKMRRDRVLLISSGIGAMAMAIFAVGLLYRKSWGEGLSAEHSQFITLTTGLALYGACNGVMGPTLESIFADSIETGKRSSLYTNKFMAGILGFTAGPLLTMVLFWRLGNHWELPAVRPVHVLCIVLLLIPATLSRCAPFYWWAYCAAPFL